MNLAACLIEVQEHERAERLLGEIVAEQPRFAGARFNQGVLFEEQGRTGEARAAYLAEVANYPNSFKARFELGKVLGALGDWAGANAQMREIVRIAPERAEGYLFLARGLLHEQSSLDDIQRLAEKGLSLATTSEFEALGWFLLADVFERRNQPDKVGTALRTARAFASSGK